MHYKITIESSETGLVSVSATAKDIGFINRVEALSVMFDALDIEQKDVPLFAGAAALMMNCREQTVKFDVGELKKQMREEDG